MSAPAAIPLRLSSFIGRKKEMGELRRLLFHTRLLTMLGPGGAGKTLWGGKSASVMPPCRTCDEVRRESLE